MELSNGTIIEDKYRIRRLLGQGGMGAVYEGENMAIARRVAIKILHADVAGLHGVVERFEREAQAAGRIGNDHILEVLDIGSLPDGARFIVMEYLQGETLEQRVERKGKLTPAELYPLIRQALLGLAAAHASSIIHRDLKPDNVFILEEKAGQQDFVKLIDFGISKFVGGDTDFRMTATGAVMGTPYYMAPEQARGSKDADHRADIYAAGVILYRAVTGQVPFEAENFNELLFSIVLKSPPKPSEHVPGLDPAFETIILKAMARDADERFASAGDFIAALDAWAQSGTAVAVPAAQTGTLDAELSLARQSGDAVAGRLPDRTGPGWTNSSVFEPRRSWSPAWLLGGTVAAASLLGVALWLSGGEPATPDSAVPEGHSSAASLQATASTTAPLLQAAAEAKAETEAARAESEAVDSKRHPEPAPSEAASEPPAPSAKPAPKRPAQVVVRRPAARRPAPTPAPAATAKPLPAKPKKRSEIDFGY